MSERELYQVVAASPSKPDDLVLIDADGQFRLYIGSTGSVSRGALNPGIVSALLERDNWGRVMSERSLTIAELQRVKSDRSGYDTLWNWVQNHLAVRFKRRQPST
jgi:hypothetical protein